MNFAKMSTADIAFFLGAMVSWLYVSWLGIRLLENTPRGEKFSRQTILVHLGVQALSFFLLVLSTGYMSDVVAVISTVGWLMLVASNVDLLRTLDGTLDSERTPYGRVSIDLVVFCAGIGVMTLAFQEKGSYAITTKTDSVIDLQVVHAR